MTARDEATPPMPRRRRRWPWLVGALLSALLVVLVPLAAVAWLVATEAGLQAAARLVGWASNERIVVTAPSGRLVDAFRVGQVTVALPDARISIEDLALEWSPAGLLDRRLGVASLVVGAIDVSLRPVEDAPDAPAPPVLVELPLSLSISTFDVGRLSLHAWQEDIEFPDPRAEPFFELRALSSALASDGRAHRIDHLSVTLPPFGDVTLAGEIDGASAPHALSAQGSFAGAHEGRDFLIEFEVAGDLRELSLLVKAQGAGLNGDVQADLAPFEAVPLRRLTASIGEIDPSAFHEQAPRAALTVKAELASESEVEWILAGPVSIANSQPDSIDRGGIPLVSLEADVRWSERETAIEGLLARLPGDGQVKGSLDWRPDPAGVSVGTLAAALELVAIQAQGLDARLPRAVIAGRVDAEGDERRQSARVELAVGKARITGEGEFIPGTGEGQGEAAGEGTAKVTPARATASGTLSAFDPAALFAEAPSAHLNLDFEVQAILADVANYRLTWRVGRDSRLEGRALGGQGRIELAGERLADAELVIELAGNVLTARGAWGRAGDSLALDVDGRDLEALGYDLSGRAKLEATLSGTRTEPSGELSLFAERLGLPGDIVIGGLNAQGRLEAGLEGPLHLALGLSGLGAASGERWLDSATLVIDGRRSEHRIDLVAITPDEDALKARFEGALLEGSTAAGAAALDGARWRGQLAALETSGRFPAMLVAPAGLSIARERIVLETAQLDAGANGRIRLAETVWTPERIVARGSLTGLALGLAAPESGPRGGGTGELILGAEWDLRLADTAEADVRVFRESGDLAVTGDFSTRIGLQQFEARLTARDNRLALSWDAAGTELGKMSGAVTALAERTEDGIWRLAPDAALLGSAQLDMPSIAWLGRLMQEEMELGGSLSAAFSISGTPSNPVGAGRIEGRALSILLVEHGLELSGGELLAEFDRDRLRLTRLEFISPNRVMPRDPRVPVDRFVQTPGQLNVAGEIALESGEGTFSFSADRLPILQRSDRWLIVSGRGDARSTWTSLDLNARLEADSGYVELADSPPPSLSDDVVILGAETPTREGGLKIGADVLVLLGDNLYLSALGIDTRLTGELRLRLRDGQPLTAVGTIATAGGTYRGFGQNLVIERGLINFQGPLDNPGLNVVALRKGLAVEAGISVAGSARRPQIRLVSEPNVPDPEKLSWIVLGRAPTAGAGADLGLLLPAAQALLGGSGGGMTDQLSRSLGFDEFGIGEGELGSVTRRPTSRVVGGGAVTEEGTVSGQVLTLGKRLSSDLFLSFEQSLGGAESLVKLTYQLTRRVSVVARGGTDNSADIYYTISFK